MTKPRPAKPEYLDMPVLSGDSIGDASRRAVRLADAKKTKVRFRFQEVDLEVSPDDDPMDGVNAWMRAQKGKAV